MGAGDFCGASLFPYCLKLSQLQYRPDCDIGNKKEDEVAQFCKSYSAIIDHRKFMTGDIENL